LPRLVVSALFAALLVGCTVVPAAPAPSATVAAPTNVPLTSEPTAVPTATALTTLAVSRGEREDATAAPTAASGADNVPTVTTPTTATTATTENLAQKLVSGMTLEQRVGQVFMLGFEGTTLNSSNRVLIHDLHLGGVTLFARNIENGPQLAKLDADLQTVADPFPMFVSVDQEGGLVVRVTQGATIFPGNMAVGATGDVALARQVAEASADELLAMGVNMSLAPVVDVNTNPLNPVIGVRSFGSDVSDVERMGQETVNGLQGRGVSAVAKHFPGHGDTAVDSHRDLPVVPHALERLQSTEFKPFEAAMQAGVDGIMTAHLYLPAIEPEASRPATLSHAVLTGLLRERLGYQGLILTDALDMEAIKRDRTAAEAAVEAFEAGADMLLVAGITAEDRAQLAEGPPALLEAVRSARVSEERLDASVLRVLEAKLRRGVIPGLATHPQAPSVSTLNSPEHRALALDAARKGVTLQRDDQHLLPLKPVQKVVVVVPDAPTRSLAQDDELASSLLEAVRQFAPGAFGASTRSAVDAARNADVVVLGTYDLAQSSEQQTLARALSATGKPVVAVALRGPYDADAAPQIGTFLTVYGDRPVHLQAAAEALSGRLTPAGRVP
jgi:beta-N-acetylhexosaminidase